MTNLCRILDYMLVTLRFNNKPLSKDQGKVGIKLYRNCQKSKTTPSYLTTLPTHNSMGTSYKVIINFIVSIGTIVEI